jgi:tripeptidyl-peptidase-1
MTPQCIAALYNIPQATTAVPGNSLGIFERGDNVTTLSLNMFFANFTPWIPQDTYPNEIDIDLILNTGASQETGEADLDFQISYPIVYPQEITSFQVDDIFYVGFGRASTTGLFNTFLDAIDGVSYASPFSFTPKYSDGAVLLHVLGVR